MMLIDVFLPPPPGTPESSSNGGPDTLLVLLIVALILGAVVLVAWLLKPLVAKRLRGHEAVANANAGSPIPRWNDTWSRSLDTADGADQSIGDSEAVVPRPDVTLDDTLMPRRDDTAREEGVEAVPVEIETPEDVAEILDIEDNETVDIMAITSTVRTLLERANAGRVREGFTLYSEAALQRFRREMGLSPEKFDEAFAAVLPPPPDQQAELAAITDVEHLPDGRIRALVSYGNGGTNPPPEFFTFVRSNGEEWLIDEIASA